MACQCRSCLYWVEILCCSLFWLYNHLPTPSTLHSQKEPHKIPENWDLDKKKLFHLQNLFNSWHRHDTEVNTTYPAESQHTHAFSLKKNYLSNSVYTSSKKVGIKNQSKIYPSLIWEGPFNLQPQICFPVTFDSLSVPLELDLWSLFQF